MNEANRLQIERYVQLVSRRKWVLVIPVVLAVVAAAIVSFFSEPVYRATAVARVDIGAQQPLGSQDEAAERYIRTNAEIIRTNEFLGRVIDDLGLDTTPKDLKKRVSTDPVAGTELVRVTAEAPSADEATEIANGLVSLLRDPQFVSQFVPETESLITARIETTRQTLNDEYARLGELQNSDASQAQIDAQQSIILATEASLQGLLDQRADDVLRLSQLTRAFTIVEEAVPPESAASPRWGFNLAAGLLAGLVGGLALALVLEYVDPTLRSARDLEEATKLPVLASIPFGVRWKYPPTSVHSEYRLLATKLQAALKQGQIRSLLFTSGRPEEGSSTVATFSAMALAQAGLHVLLLDANLSRPDLHRRFNLQLSPGLFSFISTNGVGPSKPTAEAFERIVQPAPIRGLSLLTAGTKASDPSEMLASPGMRDLLTALEVEWDAVVVDGSSMEGSASAAVLAPIVDGVVLVAAEGEASSRSVEDTVIDLTSLGANALGIVYSKATEV